MRRTTRRTLIALAAAAAAAVSARAQAPAEPPPEMTTYYFGMLVKGEKWTAAGADSPERIELQKQHLAHLKRMQKAGRLKVEMHPWMAQKGILKEPELPAPSTK